MAEKRAVCLNCMDGRVQLPVIEWIKQQFDVDYVDMITEPGMDGFLADSTNDLEDIKRKIRVSIEKNKASIFFVAGHHDCRGNPVSDSTHKDHILLAVHRLKEECGQLMGVGLWVNDQGEVEVLT